MIFYLYIFSNTLFNKHFIISLFYLNIICFLFHLNIIFSFIVYQNNESEIFF
jgi:hypothetical protein